MPIHDWSRVSAGIFHDFHQTWITEIKGALNAGLLPPEYYALSEQRGSKYEADVLTLRGQSAADDPAFNPRPLDEGDHGLLIAEPKARIRVETDLDYYRRKQNIIAIRHTSGDELVAVIEIVSQGNKSGRQALDDFVTKAARLIDQGVHLLILDLQPPTRRDPQGIHGRIWEDMTGEEYLTPADKPLSLAAYESGRGLRAFVEPIAVGDILIPMPLFLVPGMHIEVPLEETYQASWRSTPRRWRDVIEPS